MTDIAIKPLRDDNGKSDPTGNVLLLVEAAVQRLDDLRELETRRVDELQKAEMRRVNEQSSLRAEFSDKLRDAESKRIDAIRAVDVGNVAIESERQAAQANVLANQVATSAETLRGLVATTAAAQANQTAQALGQITERLASLEKTQYEKGGASAISDPMSAAMFQEIKSMRESMLQRQGGTSGMKDLTGWIVGGVLALVAIGSLFFAVFKP